MRSLILVLVAVFCLVGCDDRQNEKNGAITCATAKMMGQSAFNEADSTDFENAYRYKMYSNEEYVTIPTHMTGSNKLITLKNVSNCSERVDTDNLGEADSYMTVNYTFASLRLSHGENRIRYTVQKCLEITVGRHQCLGEESREDGTMIVDAP